AAPRIESSEDAGPEAPETRAGIFPGADEAFPAAKRTRQRNAVLLFAPPTAPREISPGLARVEVLTFQPILCVLNGTMRAGLPCAEAMPQKARVRLTGSDATGVDVIDVARATTAFRDEAGGHVYPAPYAPACCMYNTCVGRTIAYRPSSSNGAVLTTTSTIL